MDKQTNIPLRWHYPISLRLILMRSIHWILIFLILLILINGVDQLTLGSESAFRDQVFSMLATSLLLAGFCIVVLKLLYEVFFYLLFDYRVENQQLIIVKGVFWRSRATFPLIKLTDVYVERNPLELIFFVSTLQVTTAAAISGVNFGGIEGLPYQTAKSLQSFVSELASSLQPRVEEQEAKEILSENLPPETSPETEDAPKAA